MQPPAPVPTSLAFVKATSKLFARIVPFEPTVFSEDDDDDGGAIVSGSTCCSTPSGGGEASEQVILGQHSPGTRSTMHLSPTGFT